MKISIFLTLAFATEAKKSKKNKNGEKVDCTILEDSYKDNGGFELAENVYGTAFSCLENCVLTCTDLTKIEKPADEFKCWHDTEGLVTVKPACDKPKSEFKKSFFEKNLLLQGTLTMGDKNKDKDEKTPGESEKPNKKCKNLEGSEKEQCETANKKPEKPNKKPKNPCKKLEGDAKQECLDNNPDGKPNKKPSSSCKGLSGSEKKKCKKQEKEDKANAKKEKKCQKNPKKCDKSDGVDGPEKPADGKPTLASHTHGPHGGHPNNDPHGPHGGHPNGDPHGPHGGH